MEWSEFYYGLPGDQWDRLLIEAEDLLRDNSLGTHLVGIYPAGDRIYGIESEPPGLMCLYVDTVESLINPSHMADNTCHVYSSGLAGSKIVMLNLFWWARWLISGTCGDRFDYFANAVPFAADIIHQDSSIDEIIEVAHDLMLERNFNISSTRCCGRSTPLLHLRTEAILASTKSFQPCVNPAYGSVYRFPNEPASSIDKEMCELLLNGQKIPDMISRTLENIYKGIIKRTEVAWWEASDTARGINQQIALGSAIANLYRFQL